MAGEERTPAGRSLRASVEFYLLDHRTWLGRTIDVVLLGLNLVFIAIVVVETYEHPPSTDAWLWRAEVAVAWVFLVEYLLRLYGAPDRLAEFVDPHTVVDLASILPTFAVLVLPGVTPEARAFGLLRLARVFRVLRFFRFTRDEEFFFGRVSAGQLRAMKLLLTVLSIFFLHAAFFYEFEHGANRAVRNFGDAFYFSVVSLTTVGFGDIVPVTRGGRWATVGAILAGIVLIPWQVRKIARVWTQGEKVDVTCPNCGLQYHDPDAVHCKACGHVVYQAYDSRG